MLEVLVARTFSWAKQFFPPRRFIHQTALLAVLAATLLCYTLKITGGKQLHRETIKFFYNSKEPNTG